LQVRVLPGAPFNDAAFTAGWKRKGGINADKAVEALSVLGSEI
jgi:hypothetical protein